MATPSISVVIPAYNASATICAALDSVCSQTVLPSEVIVVDDVSSDETSSVVRQYIADREGAAPLVGLIEQKTNGGPAAARNAGIEASHGEWIAFLDGDDCWLPHRLEIQLGIASEHPNAALICSPTLPLKEDAQSVARGCTSQPGEARNATCSAALYGAARPVGGNTHSVLRTAGEVQPRATPDGSIFPPEAGDEEGPRATPITLEDFIYANPVATSTVLVKRDALQKTGGFDEQFRGPEDYDLWLRIVESHGALKTSEPLSLYRHVPGSLSMDDRTFLPQVIAVLEKAFSAGGALENYAERRRRAYAEKYSSASWMAFNRGARFVALRHLTKSYATYIRRILPEERDPLLRLKLLLLYLGLRPRTKS